MNLREAAEQALEYLEQHAIISGAPIRDALRAALSDTQDWDEVEVLRESLREHMAEIHRLREAAQQALPLYTAPPTREPLTDEEIDKTWRSVDYKISYEDFRIAVARAIERAHGIGSDE